MEQSKTILLQLRKWSHSQPSPIITALFFSSSTCGKTTCRTTNQIPSNLLQFPPSIHSPNPIINKSKSLLPFSNPLQIPPNFRLFPPHFRRRPLVFPAAHRFQPTMGSLDCSDDGIVTVDVKTAKDLLHSGGYGFLDVRTVEEFKEGHVATEKIINIPYLFNSPNGRVKNERFLEDVSAVFRKDEQLVVGCRSGVRSLLAIQDLQNGGYKHLKDLGGGHLAWLESHFPVAKPTAKTSTDAKLVEYLKIDL